MEIQFCVQYLRLEGLHFSDTNRNLVIQPLIPPLLHFLLKYNEHTEKGTNHKCILQWIFLKCAHPCNQHLDKTQDTLSPNVPSGQFPPVTYLYPRSWVVTSEISLHERNHTVDTVCMCHLPLVVLTVKFMCVVAYGNSLLWAYAWYILWMVLMGPSFSFSSYCKC